MENNNDFLGTEKVGRLVLRLAVPAVLAQIVNMLYNVVDRIYIGHIDVIGADALTGMGVCTPIILAVSAFASLIGMGAAPKASISMGRGDNREAAKIMGNALTALLVIAVVLTSVVLIWQEPFLYLFGASENTIGYALDYITIYAAGTIFVQLTLGMNMFITAQGFAKTGMLTVLIGAISNIVLDPVFIFVFGMGVKGAALATIISQAISAVWVIIFLCGKKTVLRLDVRNMKPDIKLILSCAALGMAPFIMQITESVLSMCFNSSLLKYGGDTAVGAMTILTSVMQFVMMPLQGFSQGAQPVISYNFGAKKLDRVKEGFVMLMKLSLGFSFVMCAVIMIFPRFITSLFASNQNLIDFAAWAIRIYMAGSCIFGLQIACQFTFIALGYAKHAVFLAILRKIILLIPLIYILPLIITSDQTMAVYLAEPVADVIAVCVTVTMFVAKFKKTLKSAEAESAREELKEKEI